MTCKYRKFEQIEEKYGKPLETILKELYAKHGNQYRIAEELGVSQGTISAWMMRSGIKVEHKRFITEVRHAQISA